MSHHPRGQRRDRLASLVWYGACTKDRFVTLIDIAIILGGILLAAWLVDGHAS